MIESAELSGIPAFSPGQIIFGPLQKVNFVFGPNGSGKTSISRALSDAGAFPACRVAWSATQPQSEVRVFNRQYVDQVVGTEDELAGVFVLGKASVEAQQERVTLEAERNQLEADTGKLRGTLGDALTKTGKLGELVTLEDTLGEDIWKLKASFSTEFSAMFDGYNGAKKKLSTEVLKRRALQKPILPKRDDLTVRSRSLADAVSGEVALLEEFDGSKLDQLRTSDLWSESIVGSAEVKFADLIDRLGNSDWVKLGSHFLEDSGGLCPFCQQQTPADIAENLAAYFDATFAARVEKLGNLAKSMREFLGTAEANLDASKTVPTTLIRRAEFDAAAAKVREGLSKLNEQVREKVRTPSASVTLPDTTAEVAAIQKLIESTNDSITAHNALIANQKKARSDLLDDCWNFFIWSELDTHLARYESAKSPIEKAVGALEDQIEQKQERLTKITERLAILAAGTMSSQSTISEINRLLEGSGFNSFKLTASSDLKDGYRVVRENGEMASTSLSEGERTFIAFLYFFHQLRGIEVGTGDAPAVVAIIDDPISSLDSSALFFVSTRVRQLARSVLDNKSNVKQLIVLTHNVYFHKEATYGLEEWGGSSRHTLAFHVIRKMEPLPNQIVTSSVNPVRTTYDLLWDEIKTAKGGTGSVGLQNSMRRIIESYFSLTGDKKVNSISESFVGVEQTICQSLISWLHDGSHSSGLFESLDYSRSGESVEQFLTVFESIFTESGHQAHYELMMGKSVVMGA